MIINFKIKREAIFASLFFMFTALYSDVILEGNGYIYSDKLNIKVFEQDSKITPLHNRSNKAIGYLANKFYYHTQYYDIGIFRDKYINIDINDGFIKTWFYLQQDFIKLLNTSTIGKNLENLNIDGRFDLYDIEGVYLKKDINLNQFNQFNIKLNFIKGREIQNIDLRGKNNENFLLDIDYIYAKRNIITKNTDNNKNFDSYGYSIDLQYLYEDNIFSTNILIHNIIGAIKWKNISYMNYKFNSNTLYKGEDGYMHLRPFGVGQYDFKKNYNQKLPMHYEIDFKYKINYSFATGIELNGNKDIHLVKYYAKYNIQDIIYKLGYIKSAKIYTFGFETSRFKFEISNQFGSDNRSAIFGYKIVFDKIIESMH
jgi:hypothetical protein